MAKKRMAMSEARNISMEVLEAVQAKEIKPENLSTQQIEALKTYNRGTVDTLKKRQERIESAPDLVYDYNSDSNKFLRRRLDSYSNKGINPTELVKAASDFTYFQERPYSSVKGLRAANMKTTKGIEEIVKEAQENPRALLENPTDKKIKWVQDVLNSDYVKSGRIFNNSSLGVMWGLYKDFYQSQGVWEEPYLEQLLAFLDMNARKNNEDNQKRLRSFRKWLREEHNLTIVRGKDGETLEFKEWVPHTKKAKKAERKKNEI